MVKNKSFSHDDHLQGSIPYRHGVGIMLINPERKIFVAQRIDQTSEAWQMPQGGINPGEKPLEAAFRELKEETCIESVNVIRETEDWFFYDFPNELAAKLWRGKFRGQRQKWFAMEFTGNESEICIETERPEFCEWKWVTPEEVPELIVDFKTRLYSAVMDEFSDVLI